MSVLALLDGNPTTAVPVTDRGLAYGDGLFETIKVRAGRPLLLALHLQRLVGDARRLGFTLDEAALRAEIAALLPPAAEGVLKVIVSRNGAGRGYRPQPGAAGRRLVMFFPQVFDDAPHPGVEVRLCRQRLAEQPALAGMKHLNRLEQVLARAEWSEPGIAEGLLLDTAGRLVEGTMSNLFLVRDGAALTPRLHRCGVAGVMRRLVLERLAPACGLPAHERDVTVDDLIAADEVFLTNSVIGIWPVLKIGCLHKRRGGVTIAVQRHLQTVVDDEIR